MCQTLEREGSLWETGAHPHRPACGLKQKKQIAVVFKEIRKLVAIEKNVLKFLKNKVKY